MDIHNNDVGIEIGKNNPKAIKEELRDIILSKIDNGELLKINENNKLIKSNGKGLNKSEIRQYNRAQEIATEIYNTSNNKKENYEK